MGCVVCFNIVEPSLSTGQVKLGVHALRLCQMRSGSNSDTDVKSETLVALLRLLESPMSFNNVILRHYLFCILQVLAGRYFFLHFSVNVILSQRKTMEYAVDFWFGYFWGQIVLHVHVIRTSSLSEWNVRLTI